MCPGGLCVGTLYVCISESDRLCAQGMGSRCVCTLVAVPVNFATSKGKKSAHVLHAGLAALECPSSPRQAHRAAELLPTQPLHCSPSLAPARKVPYVPRGKLYWPTDSDLALCVRLHFLRDQHAGLAAEVPECCCIKPARYHVLFEDCCYQAVVLHERCCV